MDELQQREAFLEQAIERVLQDGQTALEQLCEERADLATELRAKVAALRQFGLLAGAEELDLPEALGPYRLIERIGRGGMGAVYLAEQTTLGRKVALKLIRSDQLYFPGARERFQREIEAIARLHVPGVVPILDVGVVDGLPYYAMELLPGLDLAQLLNLLPDRAESTFRQVLHERADSDVEHLQDTGLFEGGNARTAARIAGRMARAVARIHEHGIVHRDLKPSNVMVDGHGRVTIVDFGLAHLTEQADGHELTRSGAMIGSVPYMAPEQLRGDRAAIGPCTDIYGIGATLHELVYREPMFSSRDQVDLVARVTAGRRSRRDGPKDLETIITCATDPDPTRRYRSADALADDLQRYLEFRPIEARPSGLLLRATRWAQRNRATAIAMIAAVLLAVGIPTVIAVERSSALAQVESERDKYELAITGVVDILGDAKPLLASVAEQEGGATADSVRDLFQASAAFLEQLRAIDSDRPTIRRSLIISQYRLAELLVNLGQFDRAQQISTEILIQTKGEVGAERMRYELRMIRGRLLEERGDYRAAEHEWQLAVKELGEQDLVGPVDQLRAARCALTIANMLAARYQDGCLDAARAAVSQFEALVAATPDDVARQCYFANARRLLAQIWSRKGETDRCLALLRRVEGDLRTLANKRPFDRSLLVEWGRTSHVLGGELRLVGQHGEAIAPLERAVSVRRNLRVIWPQRPDSAGDLVASIANLASSRNILGEPETAQTLLEDARDVLSQQLQLTPDAGELRSQSIKVYTEIGVTLAAIHGPCEASHEMFERALEWSQQESGGDGAASLIDKQGSHVAALSMCAQSHLSHGRYQQSLDQLLQARELVRHIVASGNGNEGMRRQFGMLCLIASQPAAYLKDLKLVEELLDEANDYIDLPTSRLSFLAQNFGADAAKALLTRLGEN